MWQKTSILAIIFICLISLVSATNQTNTMTLVAEQQQGGGGSTPSESITTIISTFTAPQVTVANEDLAAFVTEFGENPTPEQLAQIQADLKEKGIELTVDQIKTWIGSLKTLTVETGEIGGGGLPEDTGVLCAINIIPEVVNLDVDNIAKEVKITNSYNQSIQPKFALFPNTEQNDAVPYIVLRGSVNEILPGDSNRIIVVTKPDEITQLTGTLTGTLRIMNTGCKNIDIPIRIRTGSAIPFLVAGANVVDNIKNFFDYLVKTLSEPLTKLGSFTVTYAWVTILIFILAFLLSLTIGVTGIWGFIFRLGLAIFITTLFILGIKTLIGGGVL